MKDSPAEMTILVNGEQRQTAQGATVRALVAEVSGHALRADGSREDGGRLGIAVAAGGAVVPRSRWQDRVIAQGESIEIVTAVQGG